MTDVLREFLLETMENLTQLDTDLITLEKSPGDRTTLARVFRTLHTVKGTAGFIGLPKLQAVAHAAESLLSKLRAGEFSFNRPIATALLAVVDAIRQVLAAIESVGDEGPGEYGPLVAELDRLRETGGAGAPSAILSASPLSSQSKPPVHPHGRGEHIRRSTVALIDSGSSPRAWGTPAPEQARHP